MKNRVAWGLSAILAVVLIVGVGGTVAYGRMTGAFTIRLKGFQQRPYWQFGRGTIDRAGCSSQGSVGTLVAYWYSVGCIEVVVPYRGPDVILWNTYPKPRTPSLMKAKRSIR
jgi:hypothetical protein